jgi:phosphoribosylglycinamide formyltransferase-1
MTKKKIILMASGSGSNVQQIYEYFKNSDAVEIAMIITNKQNAGVIARMEYAKIPILWIPKHYLNSEDFIQLLKTADLIVLAGFLLKIPEQMAQVFDKKIINIHPALLPKYGGKGMYGHFVHEAVIQNKEKESGITIHYVNQHYDEGQIIAQFQCEINDTDTPETLSKKIQNLEHLHFPKTIEVLLLGV